MFVPGSRAFTILLGALTALTALSIDMSLPALPVLREQFHAGAAQAQLTISLFLIGYSVCQLISGPLSDYRGRRPVLLGGLVLYVASSVLCTLAPTLPLLILARFLQGLGAGVGPVIGRAIVRDRFEGKDAAGAFSQITQVMIVAPMVAPTIGGAILGYSGWRALFGALLGAGIVLTAVCIKRLGETATLQSNASFSVRELAGRYREVLHHRASVAFGAMGCAAFGGMFSYVSGSPLVLMDVYHVPGSRFGLFFAIPAASILLAATLNKRLIKGHSAKTIMQAGVGIELLGAAVLVCVALSGFGGLAGVLVATCIFLFGYGLLMPHSMASAMEAFPQSAGLVSSLIGCVQTAIGGVAGGIVALLYRHSALSMAVMVAVMTVGTALAYLAARAAVAGSEIVRDDKIEAEAAEAAAI